MQRIYLKDRSFTIDTLPSETGLLVELMDLCSNDDATFEMFSFAIKKDTGLTAQFLRIANSPHYRQWNEVTELKRMLVVLGLKNVRKIIITGAVQNFFSKMAKNNDHLLHRLWLRSLICAHLAEKIARKIDYPKADEAYLAGLLHQIGIMLFLVNYKENYRKILEQYETTDNFRELETANYGIDHCELGATLVESWNLDSLLSDAIFFQHTDQAELINSPALLKIISVARGLSSPPNIEASEHDIAKAEFLLQFSQDTTLECLADALDESKKVLTELGFPADISFAETTETSHADKIRELKTSELEERVKNIALTYCFINGESQNTETLIKELRVNFAMLFNLKKLVFFHQKSNSDILLPINDRQIGKLSEISFTLSDQNSAVVKCFQKRMVYDSVSQPCSIADNQIIRIMDAECAYFLPVFCGTERVGVLAVGSCRKELTPLKDKLPLIQMLLSEISKKYSALSSAEAPEDSISLTDFNKIVHEVRNPLTIINNYLYLLGRKLDADHPAIEEIDFIKEEMERVTTILAKARDGEQYVSGAKQTDINKLLDELNDFFCNSLYCEKKVRSSLTLDRNIPVLQCPENKLKQIFINIIKNAVEALPKKGTIDITTRDNCFQNGSQFVEISIKDNGPGIPTEVLKNLFNPVESTKKGHSGLGLSIVADLINEMSGTISCYSSQDMGTEFKILLPRLTNE